MRRAALILVLATVFVAGGLAAFVWFSGGSGEASAPITAPPIDPDENPTVATSPTDPSTLETSPAVTTTPAAVVTFAISTQGSRAEFGIDEILNGSPNRVIGATDQVAGEIQIDFEEPGASRLGTIVINVRTMATDSSFRDRAIRGQILQSAEDQFEFITFEPTSIDGLPDEITGTVTLGVTGDLTIRNVTQSVTFEVTLTEISETGLAGEATAIVLRSDFELEIPSVPRVVGVGNEVELRLVFVAEPLS